MDSKITKAQASFKQILTKAEDMGIDSNALVKLAALKNLYRSKPRNSLQLILMSTLPILLLFYKFNLHATAFIMYEDWRDNVRSSIQCVVGVPDTMNKIFRPAVSCSMCNNITQVDRVTKISAKIFEQRYAYSGRPVIVSDAIENWSAMHSFSYEFFQNIYEKRIGAWLAHNCQFFSYQTNFRHLGEFLNITPTEVDYNVPWYVGWSNCDVDVTEILRQHYSKPYFLPPYAEGKRLDWIFMGSKGYGAPMHVDNVEFPSWQAQLKGMKRWTLEPPPECFYQCISLQVTVKPGETIVLDTNRWYHSTEIVSDDISITIGAEFD